MEKSIMRKLIPSMLVLSVILMACDASQARAQRSVNLAANWQAKIRRMLPLLGHRNWILIVDSAYPLQISPGIETIETGQGLPEVTKYVLNLVDHSIQVRPDVYMDAELPFIDAADAADEPEVSRYQNQIRTVLQNRKVNFRPHEQLLRQINDIGATYKILVLKTNETIPYTSVFLRLDAKYWSDEAEARLREAMKHASHSPQ